MLYRYGVYSKIIALVDLDEWYMGLYILLIYVHLIDDDRYEIILKTDDSFFDISVFSRGIGVE
ncbi:hypothetical protein GCM10007938_31730 [Vibrio zhanjiangensis]|uniref:Uncharacterized protein n=1 Tax=Vibrio zhanjiangensis TaxID=1046128 RepID=A0ABQ6F399_9VIBR|nr:hypothetical protein GCM10007938_31730 [Vibrio zhanjiangensis]